MKFWALMALFCISVSASAVVTSECHRAAMTSQQLAEALIEELSPKISGEFVSDHRALKDGVNAYILKRVKNGKIIGQIDYDIDSRWPTRVHVQWVETHYDYQGEKAGQSKGVSKLMFAEMLRRHPEISVIYGSLDNVNATEFMKEYEKLGESRPEMPEDERRLLALRQTPAYKVRLLLGFGKVVRLVGEVTFMHLVVTKDFTQNP